MLQNYKIIVSYDGTDYHGWQRQPEKKTIQGTLEEALLEIASKKVNVIGSGRTDAGVHAQGQTAHFNANLRLSNKDIFRALNSILPDDIRIISIQKAAKDFHARKMAKSKVYQYRILNSLNFSPFIFRYVLHWPYHLDIKMMKEAASLFVREADFTPFSSNRLLYPIRKITRSDIKKKGSEIIYTVEANGFLRYMVRTIVGTLLEIGKGKMPPEKIEEIFKEKKRSLISPTARAKGLCLMKVKY